MAIAEYSELDGLALADLVHKGEVSAVELAEEAISRIEKHNPADRRSPGWIYAWGHWRFRDREKRRRARKVVA